jgi:hypothetical protein
MSSEVINSSTFVIALSMKSRARTCPAVLASSPVKRPVPAPSYRTDLPSNEGSKDTTYRKKENTHISEVCLSPQRTLLISRTDEKSSVYTLFPDITLLNKIYDSHCMEWTIMHPRLIALKGFVFFCTKN